MRSAVVAAALVAGAVLVWPGSRPMAMHSTASGGGDGIARGPTNGWRAHRVRAAAVAEALAVLDAAGPALRAGLSQRTALAHLAGSGVGFGRLAGDLASAAAVPPASGEHARARASPVGEVWAGVARRTGARELELVAAAWTLADTAGVPLADAVELGARLLRESRARRVRMDVLLAGPRSTMLLLTVLPIAGPIVGLLFGIDPVSLYAGSPLASIALCCGLGLLVLGRLWCRALLRRAEAARPRPLLHEGHGGRARAVARGPAGSS